MARILLLIILFWILYHVFKRFVASSAKPAVKTNDAEKIVLCSQCGLHIPESESVIKNDLIYCNNPNCKHLASKHTQHDD